jgi:hypothetical protein
MEIYEITTIGQSNREAFRGYISPEVYRQLEPSGEAMALGALRDGWAVGALTFEVWEGSLNILSLGVDPSVNEDICRVELLDFLIQVIQDNKNIHSIQSVFFPASEEERLALTISYLTAGFAVSVTESKRYVLSLEKLADSQELTSGAGAGQFRFLSDLQGQGLTLLNAFLRANPSAYIDLPILDGDLIAEISLLSFAEDRSPDAALLFSHRTHSGVSLSLIALKDKAAARKGMPLLRLAAEQVQKRFPPETKVTVDGVNDFGNALVSKLAKDAILYETPALLADWQHSPLPALPSLAEMIVAYMEDNDRVTAGMTER